MTRASKLQLPPKLTGWRSMACLIFVTALAIRAVFAMQWGETPYGKEAILDSAYFDQQAVAISNGQWLPDKVFYVPPVYQYILAVTYKVFGHSLAAVRLQQNLLGAVNCLLIALIAGRLFGASSGLLAGLMAALYRPFIFYDSMVLKTSWELLFTALFLLSALNTIAAPVKKNAFFSGIFLGLATLLRGNMIFLLPCLPLWWLLSAHGKEENNTAGHPACCCRLRRDRLHLLVFYGLGVALTLLPITASNFFLGHDLVLTGYSSGPNLWLGNNAEAAGVLVYPADMTTKDGNMEGEEAYFRSRAEQEEGRELKPSEISNFWVRRAIEYVVSHPLDWAIATADKLLLFWNNHEVSDNYDLDFLSQEFHTVLHTPLLGFGIIGPLAVVGIVCAFRKQNAQTKLLMVFSLIYMLSTLPFIIIDRYRLPLLVSFIPFAAHGLLTMVHDLMARRPERLRRHGIILLPVAVLSWSPLIDANVWLLSSYTNLGVAYLDQNNYPQAKHYFEKAIAVNPDSAPSFNNLGGVLFMLGAKEQALAMTRKAIALDPNYVEAYFHLGQMQTAVEDYDSAMQSYQRALAIAPTFPLAYDKLGQLYARVGNYPEAIANYQQALAIDPDLADVYKNLGLVYYQSKEFATARQMFERALALRPDFREAQESLRLLDAQGH